MESENLGSHPVPPNSNHKTTGILVNPIGLPHVHQDPGESSKDVQNVNVPANSIPKQADGSPLSTANWEHSIFILETPARSRDLIRTLLVLALEDLSKIIPEEALFKVF